MPSRFRRPFSSSTSPAGSDIVAVAFLDKEEMANLTTGFKRIYTLPDRGDFDDLLVAIEKASRGR